MTAKQKMDWQKLLKPVRRLRNSEMETAQIEEGRSPFQKDQDKIIFSSSFRRLSKKTQVHPLIDNDHIHTRLTHSLEVSCVGRSLGVRVGGKISNELSDAGFTPVHLGEIVQAACLAHDIGNPPFGHAGEDAIRDWFDQHEGASFMKELSSWQKNDLKLFEGNALGLRILTQTEYDTFSGGMRLSYPTLGAFLKYPWTSSVAELKGISKYSSFSTEKNILQSVCDTLGLVQLKDEEWCRHPLAYLMEAADDICYNILDLEDAQELRLLTVDYLKDELFNDYLSNDKKYNKFIAENHSPRKTLSFIRGITVNKLIGATVDTFINNYDKIMHGHFEGTLLSNIDLESRSFIDNAKEICRSKVYNHHRKIELEIGAYTCLGAMLEAFTEAAMALNKTNENGKLSFKSKRIIDLLGINAPEPGAEFFPTIMRFMDYIGGMTDQFATHIAQQILGKGAKDVTR